MNVYNTKYNASGILKIKIKRVMCRHVLAYICNNLLCIEPEMF